MRPPAESTKPQLLLVVNTFSLKIVVQEVMIKDLMVYCLITVRVMECGVATVEERQSGISKIFTVLVMDTMIAWHDLRN